MDGRTVAPDGTERSRIADNILDGLGRSIIGGRGPRGSKLSAERQLAEQYKVSGPTIREAMRALTVLKLVDVRRGSGTCVTADTGSLLSLSLGSLIRIDEIGVANVMNV